MASTTSPIPSATQALDPYIQPRATAQQIRQSLHSHLERQLRLEGAQTLSLANVANPPLTQTLPDSPPASVTGVRGAYWRALKAHQVARERYEGLRAELDVVGRGAGAAGGGEGGGGGGEGGDAAVLLLPLLRARERRRRLGAVERAVDAVEREGTGGVGAKIDEVVRRAVGDVPVLPSQRGGLGGGSGREEGELRMMELKKAILQAKATIDRLDGEDGEADAKVSSGAGELFALQQARNELIGWIEQQLAIIGDAQADEADDTSTPAKANGHEEEGHVATSEQIIQLYEHYLDARRKLLDTVNSRQDVSPLASGPDSPKPPRTSSQEDDAAAGTTATMLLPFIKPLLDTQATEQEIIQQAAYARRQLASADSNSERLLRRFADESHLVHPGASHGRDWARAGEEAGEATRELVLARAKAGEKSSREAETTLAKLKGFTGGLEKLDGR